MSNTTPGDLAGRAQRDAMTAFNEMDEDNTQDQAKAIRCLARAVLNLSDAVEKHLPENDQEFGRLLRDAGEAIDAAPTAGI